MAPRQWRKWEAALPEGLDERERYTATVLTALSSLIEKAEGPLPANVDELREVLANLAA